MVTSVAHKSAAPAAELSVTMVRVQRHVVLKHMAAMLTALVDLVV